MWVYPEQMMLLADADEPLEYLLANGAEIVGNGEPVEIDRQHAIVRLTDSIQALSPHSVRAPTRFLAEIARLTQPASADYDRPPGAAWLVARATARSTCAP